MRSGEEQSITKDPIFVCVIVCVVFVPLSQRSRPACLRVGLLVVAANDAKAMRRFVLRRVCNERNDVDVREEAKKKNAA
jgi:hypothetical protein